jgi:hypothetical protein
VTPDEELARAGARCWNWLDANAASFAPAAGDSATRNARLRAFGELVYVLSACRALAREPDPPLRRLVAFAADAVGTFDWESAVMRDARFLVPVLTMIAFLESAGRDAGRWRAVVARRIEVGILDALDLVPYRRLELQRGLERGGFTTGGETFEQLYRRCALAREISVTAMTPEDVYALTHVVFYLCDDGLADARARLPAAEVARLARLVRVCGRVALIGGALDQLAELVACAAFLRLHDPLWLAAAVRAASAHLREDGAMPAFTGDPAPDGDGFFAVYHPTLVWALAASAHAAR